jgi:hypothetical protein
LATVFASAAAIEFSLSPAPMLLPQQDRARSRRGAAT